ncbi:MAG: factor-independent urate hydroxylase [Actinomycetes bacterium]
MSPHLGANRYGKDGIRLVLVRRGPSEDGPHELRDLTVDVRLEGAFEAVHTRGDNSPVLPTDTMRSTVYALAQQHLTGAIEDFGAALTQCFLDASPAASSAEVTLREHSWSRAQVRGAPHPHSFVGGSAECATAVVSQQRSAGRTTTSGLSGLTLLKTRGSAFSGFLRDELTVLAETADRIMATEVTAEWSYDAATDPSYGDARLSARAALVATFSDHDSQSVQHTLYAMGEAVLAACSQISSIRLRMPNKHHVPVDLAALGLINDRAVFVATDRPFGVIEGEVRRS